MKVDIIKLSDTEFGDRRRQDYGDIDELAYSIKMKGIITPLAVQATPDSERPYLLIAGGRRYKAAQLAELIEIPVRIYEGELTELDFREIELFENIHRKDLGFEERCFMEREVHNLQVEKYGEKLSKAPDAPGHTLKDTGAMFGKTGEHVRQSITIADTMEKFPTLFEKCKTKSDATKVVQQIKTEIIKTELATRFQAEREANPNKIDLSDNYILNDFFEGVKGIPDGSINLVEIDPPYAIDLQKAKMTQGNMGIRYGDSYNEIHRHDYPFFMQKTLKECYRVMAEHSWLIVWFGPEPWFEKVYSWITEAGFETKRMCGIWTKPTGQNKRPERNLANTYEMFFYAKKGTPAIINPRGNNFTTPPVPPQKKTHDTERPVELMKEIYYALTFPGAKILIPFLGSGNGIIAADELGMGGFGFEKGKEFRDSFLVKVHTRR